MILIKKEDGIEIVGESVNSRVLRFEQFFGDTYKKSEYEKENKTNRNVGLIVVLMIIKRGSGRTLDRKRILR